MRCIERRDVIIFNNIFPTISEKPPAESDKHAKLPEILRIIKTLPETPHITFINDT